jgi:choline kinase
MMEVDPAMQPARLVVLASGMGSRLRSKARPKPLVELGGISLVERAVVGASHAGFDEVVVVTGHRADEIDRHVLEVSRRRGITVTVVRNERYREGNGLSALAARFAVGREPFALVMADHVFSPSLLRRLKQESVEPGEVLVAVDPRLGLATGVDPGDAMKVRLADGYVRAIGKQLSVYDAFDVGAFVCGPAMLGAVENAVAVGDSSLAGAIAVLAEAGVARALPLRNDEWWFDVDTPRDHRNGSRHVLRVTGKPLDGAVATRLNRRLSQRVVTPALLALFPRVTPNQVTLIAFAVAVAAAVGFAVGAPIVAALLVALVSVLDGSDGESPVTPLVQSASVRSRRWPDVGTGYWSWPGTTPTFDPPIRQTGCWWCSRSTARSSTSGTSSVVLDYDRVHGSNHFSGVELAEVDVDAGNLERFITRRGLPATGARELLDRCRKRLRRRARARHGASLTRRIRGDPLVPAPAVHLRRAQHEPPRAVARRHTALLERPGATREGPVPRRPAPHEPVGRPG